VINVHQRLVAAFAKFDVPRDRQIVSQCLVQKRRVSFAIQRLADAASVLYHANGFTISDFDIGYLLLHI
jgi:hypothetical protein